MQIVDSQSSPMESPDISTFDSSSVSDIESDTVLDDMPEELTTEEVSEPLPVELITDDLVNEEVVTEIIYQTAYSPEDLAGIETSLLTIQNSLQIIACLLVVIVISIVLKLCRSIVEIFF